MIYLVGTSLIARWDDVWYPLLYACLVLALLPLQIYWLWQIPILRPHLRVAAGIACGLLGIALWIGLANLQLEQQLAAYLPAWLAPQPRVSFNPFAELSGLEASLFVAVRLLGIAVVVPLAEELFWRGFLLRWLIDPDWGSVPIGEFSLASCLIVAGMFTLAHPEWLAAAAYALLLNGLLYWKRDLWQCVVAHAVSNLTLAVYVMLSGQWWLW